MTSRGWWSPALAVAAALLVALGLPTPGAAQGAPAGQGAQTAPAPLPAEPEQAAGAKAPRVYKAAAIGDSLTDFKSHGGKYLKHLEGKCPASSFKSFGKGGQMVNQMRKRFLRDLYGESGDTTPGGGVGRYTHVIVFGGVNDLYSDETAGRTVEKIEADLTKMFGWARSRGARVVAMTVAPWGGFKKYYSPRRGAATLRLNAWIKEQKASGSVDHVVDAYALLSCGDPERLCPKYALKDGLHFNAAGHEVLGSALSEEVFPDCK
jgi:lysophospholipase L1-like esterase